MCKPSPYKDLIYERIIKNKFVFRFSVTHILTLGYKKPAFRCIVEILKQKIFSVVGGESVEGGLKQQPDVQEFIEADSQRPLKIDQMRDFIFNAANIGTLSDFFFRICLVHNICTTKDVKSRQSLGTKLFMKLVKNNCFRTGEVGQNRGHYFNHSPEEREVLSFDLARTAGIEVIFDLFPTKYPHSAGHYVSEFIKEGRHKPFEEHFLASLGVLKTNFSSILSGEDAIKFLQNNGIEKKQCTRMDFDLLADGYVLDLKCTKRSFGENGFLQVLMYYLQWYRNLEGTEHQLRGVGIFNTRTNCFYTVDLNWNDGKDGSLEQVIRDSLAAYPLR